jgi:hypothetical protein
MYPFRVFLSYSHEDQLLAKRIVSVLEEMGLEPVWDKDIRPGTRFTDTIKSLIAHSHIFMPIITNNSQSRPWIHQETGYAMALNIPVLPIAIGNLPGEMISQLQAIEIGQSLENLRDRLEETNIEQLIFPSTPDLHAGIVVAELPEKRTELMAQAANWLIKQGKYGKLRQCGALSSFCIPDAEINDPVWRERDGIHYRGEYYHFLQREERKALESHVKNMGCSLIIDPTIDFSSRGPSVTRTRLNILLQFIINMPDNKVEIAISHKAREGSLTIVGDWFVADSKVPRSEGYRQTVFSWHAPTVLNQIKEFDKEFDDCLKISGVSHNQSRIAAIQVINDILKKLH